MGFAANLNALCQRAGDKAELVVRKTALELQSGMIEKTAVDTGRAKGSWMVGIGAMNMSTTDRKDTSPLGRKDSAGAILAAGQVLEGWKPGQSIWLTLSLPYARRLEEGWSQQAPSGMVRLTVQAYGDALAKAVAEVK